MSNRAKACHYKWRKHHLRRKKKWSIPSTVKSGHRLPSLLPISRWNSNRCRAEASDRVLFYDDLGQLLTPRRQEVAEPSTEPCWRGALRLHLRGDDADKRAGPSLRKERQPAVVRAPCRLVTGELNANPSALAFSSTL